MAERKLMIEVSELLLFESSVPDSQKSQRKMITETDNVNKGFWILSKSLVPSK